MAEEKKEETQPEQTGSGAADSFFMKVAGYVSKSPGGFAAFFFLLFAVGIIIGYAVMVRAQEFILYAILAPLLTGLIAYYHRLAAIAFFVLAIALILLA